MSDRPEQPAGHTPRPWVPHSRTVLSETDVAAAVTVMRSGQVNDSAETRRLETALCQRMSRRFAWATASGTDALYSALRTIGIGRGDEVLLPTYVCEDVLSAINWVGALPVPMDMDPVDLNPAPSEVSRRMTSKTKAIVVAHVLGMPARVSAFERFGVPIIEDCAHGFGACIGDRAAGSIGHSAVLSFHGLKMLTGGEGGMVLTDDERVHAAFRRSRSPDYAAGEWKSNSRLSNIIAAVVNSQLVRFEAILARRRAIGSRYSAAAADWHRCQPVPVESADGRRSSCYRFGIVIDRSMTFETVAAKFESRGVIVRRPVKNLCHRVTGCSSRQYPVAEELFDRIVSLPLYPDLSDQEAETVLSAASEVLS
jgi:perosamine synthetase